MGYSSKELDDQMRIASVLLDHPESYIIGANVGDSVVIPITVIPPNRCSDGTRRGCVLDYIDFLFPPELDILLMSRNSENSTVSVEFQMMPGGIVAKLTRLTLPQ